MYRVIAMFSVLAVGFSALADNLAENHRAHEVLAYVDADSGNLASSALEIWNLAELGFHEVRSSQLLQDRLAGAGFSVDANVAGMPTAFVASFRNGDGPIVGLLAEFDALPGVSQTVGPERMAVPGRDAGHACGHNLLGAGSTTAAIALAQWMRSNDVAGEIRVYGAPAEEGGDGKVYLVREGLFDDVDAFLQWHPSDKSDASQPTTLANMKAEFTFLGTPSHAAAAPEMGRSALDGVELMAVGTNYLREHVSDATRIHYVTVDGGGAPNVVPGRAQSLYFIRHPDPAVVRDVFGRLQDVAQGAALMAGVSVEAEVTGGVYNLLPSDTLGRLVSANLALVGRPVWNDADYGYARRMNSASEEAPVRLEEPFLPYSVGALAPVSTDASDISWHVPTSSVMIETWPLGTPSHSWQASAASGSDIGIKGAIVGAKVLALTAADLLLSPETVAEAKAERLRRRGPDFEYEPLLGDRPPPLDYSVRNDR